MSMSIIYYASLYFIIALLTTTIVSAMYGEDVDYHNAPPPEVCGAFWFIALPFCLLALARKIGLIIYRTLN